MKKNFAWPVTTLGFYDYKALSDCISKNSYLFKERKIIIFGAGIRGTIFSELLKNWGYKDLVFWDNNVKKVGGRINEYDIVPVDQGIDKSKHIIIISVENGFEMKNQLEDIGFEQNKNYFYIDNHIYSNYMIEFKKKSVYETFIFGDCGLSDISIKDKKTISLGDMIKQDLGKLETKVFAMHGMGMPGFYHILLAQMKYVATPKKVILMVNFETLTGKHCLLPRTQHFPLFQQISKYLERKDKNIEEYAQLTKLRFENYCKDFFLSSPNFEETENNDRLVFELNYMYKINMNSEAMQFLDKIIYMCQSNAIQLMVYIPPVNYQYAEKICGEKFRNRYSYNLQQIKEKLKYLPLLDLSYSCESSYFSDVTTIDESVNFEGRRKINILFQSWIRNEGGTVC